MCRADAHLRMIGGLATPPRTGSRSTVLPDNTAHPPRSLSRSLVPTAAPNQRVLSFERSDQARRIGHASHGPTVSRRHSHATRARSRAARMLDLRASTSSQARSSSPRAAAGRRGIPIRRKPHVRRPPGACVRVAAARCARGDGEGSRCFDLARLEG